jgi:hypothetical protein
MGLGALVAGTVYLSLFGPLTWRAARIMNVEPTSALLLLEFPKELDANFFASTFPRWSAPEARPVVYGFATLYGAVGVVGALVIAAGGVLRIAMMANGLFFGFYFTRFVATEALEILPRSAIEGRLLYFKLAYLMLSYYTAWALTALVSKDELAREKFEFSLSGGQALFAGWILSKGFGAAAAVYAGAVYLACTFVTLTASEMVFRRLRRFARAVTDREDWGDLEEERYLPPRALVKVVKAAWTNERGVVVISATVNLAFPALVVAIYRLVLEGR